MAVITDSFDSRTLANMEVALDRACMFLPTGSDKHRARRIIAAKIIECAHRGDNTLEGSQQQDTLQRTNFVLAAVVEPAQRKPPPSG